MTRLDLELVVRGLARSRTHALKLLDAGRVLVNGQPVDKASRKIAPDDIVAVRPDEGPDYVSRAGYKLAGALAVFDGVDVTGKRCLDAGASTGGFTDVLLRAGARHVVAADVGHDQLVPGLRSDSRVSVFEGLNVRYLRPDDIGGLVDLTVCDLSFISLTLVLAALAGATAPGGDLVLMVKPQFEVGRERLGRTGVVGSEGERRRAVARVLGSAASLGLQICSAAPSPLPGQDGNVEYFLWLKVPMSAPVPRIGEELDRIVSAALGLLATARDSDEHRCDEQIDGTI